MQRDMGIATPLAMPILEREILSGFAVLCRPHSRAYLDRAASETGESK